MKVELYSNGDIDVAVNLPTEDDAVVLLTALMHSLLEHDIESGARIIEVSKHTAIKMLADDYTENFCKEHDLSNINSLGELIELVLKELPR